ncbi:hypothetical protein [Demequina sediminicola]|uniref:hypothetical protein n=1 Tax=Demequina sediminicola TaxID=1095026 RepID=UPI0007825229|nr:hypothetical protein [Demequina sediminicola]
MRATPLPAELRTAFQPSGDAESAWGGSTERAADPMGDYASSFLTSASDVPSDWPESVPVPEWGHTTADATSEGWQAAVTGPALSFDDYVGALEDAGFTPEGTTRSDDAGRTRHFDDGALSVTVTWSKQPGQGAGLLTVEVASPDVEHG